MTIQKAQLHADKSGAVRIHAVVTGRVQGVGFRYYVVKQARSLHISGWVRNRSDGSVETEAQGSDEDVTDFITLLKTGPEWSKVEHVNAASIPITEFTPTETREPTFTVRPDAR
ncbi:acylphosphatase [Bifidobacterium bombi]|uniref:Acylphosphatase n=1 Tax=Bifidobacterium bombi DSM 19703 TaxID=1341695 RepID=A0A086BNF2_9BIFI|nr:acylphosphatase [Bifidobacterium bombi]KFF30466.1 acylphosphatase [Bifidobacterium bombi DSM 19703]